MEVGGGRRGPMFGDPVSELIGHPAAVFEGAPDKAAVPSQRPPLVPDPPNAIDPDAATAAAAVVQLVASTLQGAASSFCFSFNLESDRMGLRATTLNMSTLKQSLAFRATQVAPIDKFAE